MLCSGRTAALHDLTRIHGRQPSDRHHDIRNRKSGVAQRQAPRSQVGIRRWRRCVVEVDLDHPTPTSGEDLDDVVAVLADLHPKWPLVPAVEPP